MRKRAPELFAPKPGQRSIAYDFVLERLASASPTTRPMFGSTAVYLDERVVFILRKKGDADDGVWLAYQPEREAEVLALLPNLTRIARVPNARGWRKLAEAHEDFEDDVLRACRIAREPGSPLGKIPMRQAKKKRAARSAAEAAKKPAARKPSEAAPAKAAKKSATEKASKAAPGKAGRGATKRG